MSLSSGPGLATTRVPEPPGTWKSCGVLVASPAGEGGLEAVALVSDRRLTAAALAALLVEGDHRAQVETAQGLVEVRRMIENHRPDVVVVDVSWPWPAAVEMLTRDFPVLLLLDPEADDAAFSAAHSLAPQGCLARTASQEALRSAITAVRTMGSFLDPVLAGRMRWAGHVPLAGPRAGASLSSRERLILAAIAGGRSSKEIARDYSVTPKTICNHISNMYTKLNLRHRGELVLYAAREGIARPGLGAAPVDNPAA